MDEHRERRGVRAGRHAREGESTRARPAPSASPAPPAPQPIVIARPDPVVPARGALLAGRYRLTTRLSAGTADVWRAEDELLGRAVALKLAVAATQGSAAAGRLLSEARALAAVRHPNIVALHDVLTGTWGTALVLEVLPGETLAARLSRDGPVSAPIAISVAMQLAAALEAVHQAGLVHRDVKPGNVIIRPDGAVRLIDFGIARPAGDRHGLTPAGKVEGTLRSISPEQLAGGAVTPATDLFGLGTVLFELLEGRPPFDATDPERLTRLHRLGRPPVILAPPPLADLLSRLLEPNPAARPSSAAAVLDQLRAIAGVLGQGGAGRADRATRRAGPRPRPRSKPPSGRKGRFRLRAVLIGGLVARRRRRPHSPSACRSPATAGGDSGRQTAGAESSPRRTGTPAASGGRSNLGARPGGGPPRSRTPKPTPEADADAATHARRRRSASTTRARGDARAATVILVRGHRPAADDGHAGRPALVRPAHGHGRRRALVDGGAVERGRESADVPARRRPIHRGRRSASPRTRRAAGRSAAAEQAPSDQPRPRLTSSSAGQAPLADEAILRAAESQDAFEERRRRSRNSTTPTVSGGQPPRRMPLVADHAAVRDESEIRPPSGSSAQA